MSEYEKSDTTEHRPKCSDINLEDVFKGPDLKDEKIPQIPGEDLGEYNKIQKIKRQPFDDTRKTAKRAAKKAYDDKQLEIELAKVTAQNVHNTAVETQKSDTKKEENRVKEKIATYFYEYINNLLTAINGIPSIKKCDSYEELPDYIKAVHATTFYKKVAELKIEYQTKIDEINKTLFEADKTWDLAQKTYDNAKCAAEAQKEKADLEADLAWRTSLMAEVKTACQS